jgi:hypothetical protein
MAPRDFILHLGKDPVHGVIYSIEILLTALLALKVGKYMSSTLAGLSVYLPVYLGKSETVNDFRPFIVNQEFRPAQVS